MKKEIGIVLIVILIVFGNLPGASNSFPTNPYYTDDFGDGTEGNWQDIKYIWVDNNESFIMFKVELAAPFNDSIGGGHYLRILISVDNSTGSLEGDFMVDYMFRYMSWDPGWYPRFWDQVNPANRLEPVPPESGLMYFVQSNNNHTFEIGYKLKSNYTDKGYLNISLGQKIYFKVEMGVTSDWAPDINEGNLSYTLKFPSSGGIPGFQTLPVILGLIALIIFPLRKKVIPD